MGQQDLGEQAISKAAEIGIENQLDDVEELDVDIRANPLELASGEVESVTIDAKGMVMQKDLRAERLILQTDEIALDGLKAALGNIELEHSTNAEAKIVLLEEDIQRAFNSEYIENKLKNQRIKIDGETKTVNAEKVRFTLPGEDKINLSADLTIVESNTKREIALSAKPQLEANGNKITIADVEYHNPEDADFAKALLDSMVEVLDLRNFELDEMSLRLTKLDVCEGKIIMAAAAEVHKFPN